MAFLAALVGLIFFQVEDGFVGVQDRLDDWKYYIVCLHT